MKIKPEEIGSDLIQIYVSQGYSYQQIADFKCSETQKGNSIQTTVTSPKYKVVWERKPPDFKPVAIKRTPTKAKI